VRVEDVDGRIEGPGSLEGLRIIARGMGGHACLLPMRQHRDGRWQAAPSGWGLINVNTHQRVGPVALISEERIEGVAYEPRLRQSSGR
jgi:hypothetical protein